MYILRLTVAHVVFGSLWQSGERELAVRLHDLTLRSSILATFFRGATLTVSLPGVVLVGFVGAAIAMVQRRSALVVGWLVVVVGGELLCGAIKTLVQRPRPFFDDPIAVESTASFPSGHSFGAVVAFGFLAYAIAGSQLKPRLRRVAAAGLIGWILIVGISRLFLGAHFLSDVLGSLSLGLAWLIFAIALTERLKASGHGVER